MQLNQIKKGGPNIIMKKLLTLIMATIISCSVTLVPVYAANLEDKSYAGSATKVLDYSFLSTSSISEQNGAILLTREAMQPSREPQNQIGDTSIVNEIQEIVYLIPNEKSSTMEILRAIQSAIASRSTGSKFEEDLDASLSARGHLTINYDRKVENSRSLILLTQVSGGCEILDSHTQVDSQEVAYGCSGLPLSRGQSTSRNPRTLTWSYSCPSTWEYVYDGANLSTVGAFYGLTLRRPNGYLWTLEINNNIVGNFSWDW